MFTQFEDFQKLGKENVDSAMKAFGAASKTGQALTVEVADYSKKAFENATSHVEKLFGVKSFEKAIELQQAYLKSSYEGFVAHATKVGELTQTAAKELLKPVEAAVAKAQTVAK
jgi:hypothetical protein